MRAVLKALGSRPALHAYTGAGTGGAVGGATTALAGGDTSDVLRAIGTGALIGGAGGLGAGGLAKVLKTGYAPGLRHTAIMGTGAGLTALNEDARRAVLGEKPLHIPAEMIDPNDPYFQEYYMQMQMQRPELFKQSSARTPAKKATTTLADIETMEKVSGQVFGRVRTPEGVTIVESNGKYMTYDKTGEYTYGTFDTLEGAKTASWATYSYNPEIEAIQRRGFFGIGRARNMGSVSAMDAKQRSKIKRARGGKAAFTQARAQMPAAPVAQTSPRPQPTQTFPRPASSTTAYSPRSVVSAAHHGDATRAFRPAPTTPAPTPTPSGAGPRAPASGFNPTERRLAQNLGITNPPGATPVQPPPSPHPRPPATPAPTTKTPTAPAKAPGTLGKVLRRGGALGASAALGYGLYRYFNPSSEPAPPPSTYDQFMTGASRLLSQAPQYLQAAQQMGFLGGGGGGYGQYQQMNPYQRPPMQQGYGHRPYY